MLIIVILTGCNNNKGPKQEDYDKLQAELTDCKKTVEELSNTPQMRLANGQKFQAGNDFTNAKKEYKELIEKFPGTVEAQKATTLISEIEKVELERKVAEERKKTLGFKAIKENTSLKIGELTINFNSVNTGAQWVFDNYGSEWDTEVQNVVKFIFFQKFQFQQTLKIPVYHQFQFIKCLMEA